MRLNFRQRRLVEISFYNSIEVNAKRSQPSAAPTWNAIGVGAAEGCDLDGLEVGYFTTFRPVFYEVRSSRKLRFNLPAEIPHHLATLVDQHEAKFAVGYARAQLRALPIVIVGLVAARLGRVCSVRGRYGEAGVHHQFRW